MKNNQNTLKILLDTSFILPTLGIDVGYVSTALAFYFSVHVIVPNPF